MSLAQAARELIAAGVTGDALCDALERIEAANSRVIEAHPMRSKEADRAARYRARKRDEIVTRHDYRDESVISDAAHLPPKVPPNVSPMIINSTPSFPPPSPPPVKRGRGFRLPDGWKPSDEGVAFAEKKLGRDGALLEFDRFTDFWRSKSGPNAIKLDWEATWRNWARSAADRLPQARAGPVKSGYGKAMDFLERVANGEQHNSSAIIDADFERLSGDGGEGPRTLLSARGNGAGGLS